jgi:hypothetical protein
MDNKLLVKVRLKILLDFIVYQLTASNVITIITIYVTQVIYLTVQQVME